MNKPRYLLNLYHQNDMLYQITQDLKIKINKEIP